MEVRNSLASQAYLSARTAAAPQPGGDAGAGERSFARMAADLAGQISATEGVARAAMVGGADPHALVEALASSQFAVETVATVRDRVVEAYQEILRMPV